MWFKLWLYVLKEILTSFFENIKIDPPPTWKFSKSDLPSQLDTHCRLKVVQFLHKEYSVNIAVDYVSITAILHNFDLQ